MSDVKIFIPEHLREPGDGKYVNNKLVPVVDELSNALKNILSESSDELDMTTSKSYSAKFVDIDTFVVRKSKKSFFLDPSKDPTSKGSKFKVRKYLVTYVVYSSNGNLCQFRLVNTKKNKPIYNSVVTTSSTTPDTIKIYLTVSRSEKDLSTFPYEYHVQGKYVNKKASPICRDIRIEAVYSDV